MHAKIYVAQSPIHGLGLFAAEPIRRHAWIGTFKGPRARRDGTHVLWIVDENDNWRGRRGRNKLRYLNHDAAPNAEFHDFDLYALRPIAPDEEITIDYGE